MKIKELLKTSNIKIFKDTICIWDSYIDSIEKLCDIKDENIGGIEIYLEDSVLVEN